MPRPSKPERRATGWTDWLVAWSMVPAALTAIVLTLGSLVLWFQMGLRESPADSSPGVSMQVLHDSGAALRLETVLPQLHAAPASRQVIETGGSLDPFWLRIELPTPATPATNQVVVFRSPGLQTVEMWLRDASGTLHGYDRATRQRAGRMLQASPIGFSAALPPRAVDGPLELVARLNASGTARIDVRITDLREARDLLVHTERRGGILFGALAMLAVSGVLIWSAARDPKLLYFAGWSLTGLWLAASTAGFDRSWGLLLPEVIQTQQLRQVVASAYAMFTAMLFRALCAGDLRQRGIGHWSAWTIPASVLTLGLSILLPTRLSTPLFWTLVVTALPVLVASVLLTLFGKSTGPSGSATARFSAVAWLLALIGHLVEAGYTAGVIETRVPGVNNQVATIMSAFLVAFALAEGLNHERRRRVAAQGSALAALQRMRENYDASPIGLFTLDARGAVTESNSAFRRLFGFAADAAVAPTIHFDDVFGQRSMQDLGGKLAGADSAEVELPVDGPGGGRRWFQLRAVRKNDRIEGSIQEITHRKQAEERLAFLAEHDPLTGLINRRGLEACLQQALARTRAGVPASIAYLDLDRFKLVNDLFGHPAGDHVLEQVAARLRETIGRSGQIARVGGDEFVIVFDDSTLAHAEDRCARVLQVLSGSAYTYQDKAFTIDGSIGLIALEDPMSERDAIAASDRACREAKRLGGSKVMVFTEGSDELRSHLEEIRLVAGMREHFPADRMFTVLQPVVSLHHPHADLSYEVLVRMRDADGRVIPPGRFIGAAERNGVMTKIDRWVLEDTLRLLDENPAHRDRVDFVTMNLSGASLNDERFVEDVLAIVRDHPHAAGKLCFEITETIALYDLNNTRRFVDRIKSFGARLALDDFGAGYSSFSYLKELPGDIIKIDGGFIRDVNLNPANFAIARAIIDLGHELGMACVAEWAENADIVRSLLQLGADYAQGYALSRPLPQSKLIAVPNAAALVLDDSILDLIVRHNAGVQQRPGGPKATSLRG